MPFIELLGKHLKSDEVLEILEHFDMTVIYDFDRIHENMSDLYWAAAKPQGFQFRFDAAQVLDTVFMYATAREGFLGIDRSTIDVPFFETFEAAHCDFVQQQLAFEVSPGQMWIKGDHHLYTAHYQYKDGRLAMVTLSLRAAA